MQKNNLILFRVGHADKNDSYHFSIIGGHNQIFLRMETLKFVCKDKKQQEFADTVRKKVNDYFNQRGITTKGNYRMVLKSAVMLTVYILPLVLVLTVSMPYFVSLLMWLLMGTGMAGIGMCIMHDAIHGAYSNKKWINKMMGGTMYILGSNVLNWRIQDNNRHHIFTNTEGFDHDISSRGPLRLSQFAPLRRIYYYQHIHAFFFYGLITIIKLGGDFTQFFEFKRSGFMKLNNVNIPWSFMRMLLVKILYLFAFLVLPVMFTNFTVLQILLGFFLMHWIAGCILSTTFQMAHIVEGSEQHLPDKEGLMEVDWTYHQLRTSSDCARDNVFIGWYLGGLNFQIEHHLFPTVCHIHYRKIAPIVEQVAKDFGYRYNIKQRFTTALRSHVGRLKVLGRQAPVTNS